ncbi:MAG: YggT family protein [bacterium]
MTSALAALAALSAIARVALLGVGVVLLAVATADWAARTRRINPFNGVARFLRARVDPRLGGIERQVLRAGGHPSNTPWWALVAYVVLAALLLAAFDMAVGLVQEVAFASAAGPTGFVVLMVRWTFGFLRLALLVRVLTSWFPRAAGSPWFRWSYGATEWMLRPLRRVIPTLGMVDITPIVAYFGLQLLEGLVSRVLLSGMA